PQWPVFCGTAFTADLGIRLTTVNDMVAMLAGVAEIAEEDCELLTSDVTSTPSRAKLAVAIGTGVGVAFTDQAGGLHATEAGHVSWQAVTALEADYLDSIQKMNPGVTISVEWSIGGFRGFDQMYDFISGRKKPGPYIQERINRYRREHRG